MSNSDLINILMEGGGLAEAETALETRITQLSALCESPIELLFLTGLDFQLTLIKWQMTKPFYWSIQKQSEQIAGSPEEFSITVVPQYRWQNYRIDFAFFLHDSMRPAVFVECDGHDFHERTPEQAERDRRRDRVIQQANIPILRFTGREIYRSAFDCSEQIVAFLLKIDDKRAA